MTKRYDRSIVLALAALLVAAGAARADWLVTRDGARLETKGPWKVDGRRVVFTLPNGTLSALRTDDVDLDQSAAVTAQAVEAARRAAEPVPEAKREPVLRLTEKELPPVGDGGGEAEAGEAGEGGEGGEAGKAPAPTGRTQSTLEIVAWEKIPNASGESVDIFGTVKNSSDIAVTEPTILVMIYGPDGGLLATNEGTVNAGMLAPGASANFRVSFTGVGDFDAARFDAQGRGFRVKEGATGAEEGGEAPGEEGSRALAEPPAEEGAIPPG